MAYHTKQQQAILRFLELRKETPVSAAALAEELKDAGMAVGLATVYRQLERLEQAGAVHRVNTEEGALYQYCPNPEGHSRDCFLVRCSQCGRIIHLDCGYLRELCVHLSADHGFTVDPRRTILTGLCGLCQKEEPHAGQ